MSIPSELLDLRDGFREWLPLERKLAIGARITGALDKPKVDLYGVWPVFARWIMFDDTYGGLQFMGEHREAATAVAAEIHAALLKAADGIDVEPAQVTIMGELCPIGERLGKGDNPAAGAVWQMMHKILYGHPALAMRYFVSANVIGQPGERNTVVNACIKTALHKFFELLKA